MNQTPREKLLLSLLPAVLAVLVWWGYLRPTKKFRDTEAAALTAEKNQLTPAALAASVAKNEDLAAREAEADRVRADAERTRRDLIARFASSEIEHSVILQRVTDVLQSHGLTVLSGENAAAGNNADSGRSFQDLVRRLTAPPPAVPNQSVPEPPPAILNATREAAPRLVWRIEFVGTYAAVQRALEETCANVPQAVPLRLEMAPAQVDLAARRWKLVISL